MIIETDMSQTINQENIIEDRIDSKQDYQDKN